MPHLLLLALACLAFFYRIYYILDLQRANQRFAEARAEQFGDSRGQEAGGVCGGFVGMGGALASGDLRPHGTGRDPTKGKRSGIE